MKRIKWFSFLVVAFLIGAVNVNAASFSVTADKKNVVVGNNVNVTVTVNGAAGWEYCVTYDSSLFKLVSSKSDMGNQCVKTGSTLIGYKTVTYTFKSLKSGTGTFGLSGANAYDDHAVSVQSTKGSVSVSAKTQAEIIASYSDNANLKSLGVDGYELNPSFNKDTLEYSLVVENNIESVNISANKADANASISGAGTKELSEGNNKFEIVVTAQKGNTKTYVINIERKELEPVYVSIDKNTYSLVRKEAALPELTGFTKTTVNISDTEIPALYSEITKYMVVGVKDSEGNITTYIYDNDKYIKYNEFTFSVAKLYFKDVLNKELPKGYNKVELTINNTKVVGYKVDNKSKTALVYGVNVETGDEGLYVYDSKLNTVTTYDNSYQEYLEHKNMIMLYISIIFISLFVVIFVVFVVYIINTNHKINKLKEAFNNKVEKKKKKTEKALEPEKNL